MRTNSTHPTPALAAYAAGETINPLWISPSGRAFYPIAGGAPDDDKGGDGDKDKDKGGDGDKDKGDKGYKPPATQEELNRIIGDRLAREKEKYSDYDDLKAKADAHDKTLEEAMTESERAVAAAKKAGSDEQRVKNDSRLVRAEARALAAEAKFRNPSIAIASLDLSKVKVDEDGEVDAEAIKTLLKKLAESDSYLVDDGKKPGPKADRTQGGDGDNGSRGTGVSAGQELFANRRGKKTTTSA